MRDYVNPATGSSERPDAAGGLCGGCHWARRIENRRGSAFLLCERHRSDPRFRKYPALPVLACEGFEPREEPR